MWAELAPERPLRAVSSASSSVARYTARRTIRPAVLWGYVFGITVASSAYSYTRIYKTPAERARLAMTFGANHAASALFGPAQRLDTVAGFTVFKASMTLMIIGAVWGLLTSTRLLRGDEEAGRWAILVSGQTTRDRAVAQVLGGLGSGAFILWLVTALITVMVGRLGSVRIDAPAALYFALSLVASTVIFLALGAVTAQLAPSRQRAASYAAIVLGLSYALRMVADAGAGLHWLVWASPLGWIEQLQPLTNPEPWVLALIGVFTVALGILAVLLARRRDVGASTWKERSTRSAQLGLLSGPTRFTVRLTRPSIVAWIFALAITGLMMGIVAKAAGSTIAGSSIQQVFSRLGARGAGTATFLGVAFLIIAIVATFQAASSLSAARAEEANGHLDHQLAGLVGRDPWFVGRLATAAVAILTSGVAAGLAVWVGARAEGSVVGVGAMVAAGVNAAVPALFLLGSGALFFGVWPRRTSLAVYAVLGWSALIEVSGGFFSENHWVLDTSVFHQIASAPAVAANWTSNGILIGIGLAATVAGRGVFLQRDLQGE